jgi:hypothetical protein
MKALYQFLSDLIFFLDVVNKNYWLPGHMVLSI